MLWGDKERRKHHHPEKSKKQNLGGSPGYIERGEGAGYRVPGVRLGK